MRPVGSTKKYETYVRRDSMMPHIWCAGCGHGTAMKAILQACAELDLNNDDVVMVSGIGCSSRMPGSCDFNTVHTAHGRALAFATGIKMVAPEKHVIVISGDGDASAIGGNHFIHACRRNINITLCVLNNYIYGMTGGQYSPTTAKGAFAKTAPYSNIDSPFDLCKVAEACGASYVARGSATKVRPLPRMIKDAISNKGFSVVDIFSQCPTYFGRMNKKGRTLDLMKYLDEITLSKKKWEELSDEEKLVKYPTGVLHRCERPEYVEQYDNVIVPKAMRSL